MPYTAEHKDTTRVRIIDSARKLFNRRGFSDVSIDEIMAGAGLTRGGFYNHFGTKDEVYAEAITRILACNPVRDEDGGMMDLADSPKDLTQHIIRSYLSRRHLDDVDSHCPLIALPSDVSRSGPKVKEAYQKVLESMIHIFESGLEQSSIDRRRRAMSISALCIGAMALARAINDEELSEEIRQAALASAFELGQIETHQEMPKQARAS